MLDERLRKKENSGREMQLVNLLENPRKVSAIRSIVSIEDTSIVSMP
jgi:hypothetical protein